MSLSDAQRYTLAVQAGFSPADAVTITAISIAENGSGDPAALSPPNSDGTRDLGMLQVNERWWPQFGGYGALVDPLNNFRAGRAIKDQQGWGTWATYNGGEYLQYLPRVQAASAAYLGTTSNADLGPIVGSVAHVPNLSPDQWKAVALLGGMAFVGLVLLED